MTDQEQQKALRLAVLTGDMEELDRLIGVGANLDALGHDGTTPLMLAVKSSLGAFYDRGVDIVKFLLARGADRREIVMLQRRRTGTL